jgi:hypothetical protein
MRGYDVCRTGFGDSLLRMTRLARARPIVAGSAIPRDGHTTMIAIRIDWTEAERSRDGGSMARSVSLAGRARERHPPHTRTRRDWRCGVSPKRAERVMRGAARIGEGRDHADSCVTRGSIGRWAWPRPPSRRAIGPARATK